MRLGCENWLKSYRQSGERFAEIQMTFAKKSSAFHKRVVCSGGKDEACLWLRSYPTYRRLFEPSFQMAANEEWSALASQTIVELLYSRLVDNGCRKSLGGC